jgi:hypothetical protein
MRDTLLPVPYHQVVFTLPQQLRPLAAARPRAVYRVLFSAVRQTLTTLAADPRRLGGTLGLLLVLHTWTQELGLHPHIHVVVPAGGLSLDKQRWIAGSDEWFLPVQVLGQVFGRIFLDELHKTCAGGGLRLAW